MFFSSSDRSFHSSHRDESSRSKSERLRKCESRATDGGHYNDCNLFDSFAAIQIVVNRTTIAAVSNDVGG